MTKFILPNQNRSNSNGENSQGSTSDSIFVTSKLGKISGWLGLINVIVMSLYGFYLFNSGSLESSQLSGLAIGLVQLYFAIVLVFAIPTTGIVLSYIGSDGLHLHKSSGTFLLISGAFIFAILVWIAKPLSVRSTESAFKIELERDIKESLISK